MPASRPADCACASIRPADRGFACCSPCFDAAQQREADALDALDAKTIAAADIKEVTS